MPGATAAEKCAKVHAARGAKIRSPLQTPPPRQQQDEEDERPQSPESNSPAAEQQQEPSNSDKPGGPLSPAADSAGRRRLRIIRVRRGSACAKRKFDCKKRCAISVWRIRSTLDFANDVSSVSCDEGSSCVKFHNLNEMFGENGGARVRWVSQFVAPRSETKNLRPEATAVRTNRLIMHDTIVTITVLFAFIGNSK